MSISGIGSSSATSYYSSIFKTSSQSTPSTNNSGGTSSSGGVADTTSDDSVAQQFMKLASESPAQRMVDLWLKEHHLTQAELNQMPAAQRDAIEKQMQQDIKNSIKDKTGESGPSTTTDISV